ncbi:T9SS type A sorting domain-containing protein [uncultured Arcticibacterium sp.]|uniref:Ig-like domain-containing protein n=1 Tax=uncultured Arcticibacterium sp. TaxID=2173042 RepID=UPI0030FB0B0E
MRLSTVIFLLFVSSRLVFSQEPIPASVPFECESFAYLFQNRPTDIIQIDLQTGNSTEVASNLFGEDVSAGYNRADNFIYLNGKQTGNLYKVDKNWNFTTYNLGINTGLYNADIDANGIMYMYKGNTTKIIRYDLNVDPPAPISSLTTTKTSIADYAFNPIDGFLYGVDNRGRVYQFNPANGARTITTTVTGLDRQTYGAVYFDANGTLYLNGNSNGKIFTISHSTLTTGSPSNAVFFSQATKSGTNDGARCVTAPLCKVGNTAPNLSSTNISNGCGETSVNLGTISADNTPDGTVLTWHTASPPTNANKISNLNISSSGTYYATFYDSENDCYSASNTMVTVTIVNVPTTPSSLNASPSSICEGASSNLTGTCSVGTINWYQNNTSGTLVGTGSPLSVSPSATTNYVATCKSASPACESSPSSAITVTVNPTPTAPTITAGNTQICQGNSTKLTATGCSGTINWSSGDTGSSVTVSPAVNTDYTATCTNTTTSCVSTNSNTITVTVVSSSGVTISIDKNTICNGETVNLLMSNCSGTISWFEVGNVVPIGNTASLSQSPSSTTAYNALCDASQAAYCSSSGSNIDVIVNNVPSAPSISITGNSTICTGETTTLEATGCSGTVSWSNSQTGTSITVSPSVSPTTYTATCTENGCTSPSSTGVDVAVNPIPDAPSGISSVNICSGDSSPLNGMCSGTSTLTWYEEDALTNLVTLPVSPTSNTTYYGVCSENGCSSAPSSINVNVTTTPSAPSDISTTGTSICEGESVVIGSTCSGTANLKWFTDALLTNELASTTVSPTSTTTYYAACQNGICLSTSKSITITVSPAPAAPTGLSTSTDICKDDSYDLIGACEAGNTIQWYLSVISPSTLVGTVSPQSVSPTETTIYIATCKNNSTNCESPKGADIKISVKDRPNNPTNLTATPSSICSGESSDLAGTCSTGTLTWYEDAGLTTVTASTVSPTSTTTYYASCVLSSCQSLSQNITINVSPTPVAPTSVTASPTSICDSESSTLSATCATGTLTWFSDAALTTAVGSTVSPSATATYYASCVSGSCKSAAGSVEITVTAIPPNPTSVMSSSSTICEGSSTTLTATCASGTLTWYTDQALSTTLGSTTVSPTNTTTYYASCIDGVCKSPYVSQTVEVNELPAAPTIEPGSRNLCQGASLVLTASGCVGNITWSNGKTTASITETPADTTSYSATCTNPNTGCISPVSAVSTINVVFPPPIPSISANKTQLCLGESVTLTSFNCTGDNPVVNWFESMNSIGSGTSINHIPTVSGTASYTANCVTTTSNEVAVQCESGAADPIEVTVNSLPNIPSISTTDNAICEGESTTLNATNCGSGSVKWSDGQTGASITVSPTTSTDYQAVCVLNGCESDKSTIVAIQVTAIPETPSSLAGPAICSGESSTLSGTCTNGSSISWFSDAALTTSVTSPVSPTETSTYYAICTLNTCQSSSASHTVEVTETPAAPSSTSASPSTVCAGDRSELSGACTLGNLVWYEDAALNTPLASTIVNPTSTITYYAACENGTCKSLGAAQIINVNPLPAAPTLSADENTICEGSSSNLAAASCTGTVTWSTGETGNTITVTPNRTTTYTATCTDANSCTSLSSSDLVITVILPPFEPTITNSSPSICPGGSSTLTAVGCNDGVSWYESGSTISFASTASVLLSPAISTGYYAVCESPGTTCPSIESDEEPIIVKALPTITDILAPSCNDGSVSMMAIQTSRGSNSTVSVSNGLTASFDNDGRENDSRTVWVIENIPNSTNFTVTVNENGCETSQPYSSSDCSVAAANSFPLELVSFSGQKINETAELVWTVSNEIGVSHFDIERGFDAISFERIGKVAAENLLEKHSYIFTDKSPKAKVNYYRLKSIDIDGATSYSKIIAIDFRETDALKWSLYPNPVEAGSKEINIKTKGNAEELSFRLLNINGVGIKINTTKNSSTEYTVEFGSIPTGTYFLQAENSKDISTKKFIKLD